jgi:hypothetical protein
MGDPPARQPPLPRPHPLTGGGLGTLTVLAQSLGLAYASGISLYATVAFAGLAQHLGWLTLPGPLHGLGDPIVIAVAGVLTGIEVLASLVPGIATAWEAVHTAIRPVAAGALAAMSAWGSSPRVVILAALLGGALGFATHATKLGLRAAVDLSPEPVSNAAATTAELSVVAALAWAVWNHPWLALAAALALLVAMFFVMRALWRLVRRAVRSTVGG